MLFSGGGEAYSYSESGLSLNHNMGFPLYKSNNLYYPVSKFVLIQTDFFQSLIQTESKLPYFKIVPDFGYFFCSTFYSVFRPTRANGRLA